MIAYESKGCEPVNQAIDLSRIRNGYGGKPQTYQYAGKLMVSRPNWEDDHGEMKPGKTVTLDLTALKGQENAREILMTAIDYINE